MLDDDGSWFRGSNANHLWYFDYPHFMDGQDGAFCIRSVLSHMYLTVDVSAGKLVLETGKPESLWKFHDATKKYKSLTGRLRGKTEMAVSLSIKTVGTPAKLDGDVDKDEEEYYQDDDEEDGDKLQAFAGTPATAFETMVAKQLANEAGRTYGNDNPFMSIDDMLEKKTVLCDGTDTLPFPEGMTVGDIFPTLYGAQSDLFRRFHERRNDTELNFAPPRPFSAEGAAWASVATLSCKVPIPILGCKPYKEIQRLVLCQQGNEKTLAVQTLGKVQAGWYGEFGNENLYLFSQTSDRGPIRFQAVAPTPTGRFAGNALDGYKKSLSDFVAVAKEILQDWSPRPPSPRKKSKDVAKENVPPCGQTSVTLPPQPPSESVGGLVSMCGCCSSCTNDELVVFSSDQGFY